ncbi:anti-sigma factor family protein [Alkaliphilus crotonatoxidans]
MDCKTSSNLMMSYMDQTISKEEWKNLQQHLATCESCREEFDLLGQLNEMLDDLELLEPNEGFEERVMTSIDPNQYVESKWKLIGYKELFFSIGIYYTFLLGIQGVDHFSLGLFTIMERILLFSELVQKLVVGAFALLVLYPRNLLKTLIGYLSQGKTSLLLIYGLGFATMMLLMFIIQGTLYRILTTREDGRNE